MMIGLLARAALIKRQDIALDLHHFLGLGQVPTDNFLDAIAMALVALAWERLGDDLQVIRSKQGVTERLGENASQTFLMALPEIGPRRAEQPLTPEALLALASEFGYHQILQFGV